VGDRAYCDRSAIYRRPLSPGLGNEDQTAVNVNATCHAAEVETVPPTMDSGRDGVGDGYGSGIAGESVPVAPPPWRHTSIPGTTTAAPSAPPGRGTI